VEVDVLLLYCQTVKIIITKNGSPNSSFYLDFEQQKLNDLTSILQNEGYGTYLTSVGGSGLGILPPYILEAHSTVMEGGPVTPPETPNIEGDEELRVRRSYRAEFEGKRVEELADWVERRGRWLFV
jgi:hypothetical protein